jgi:hypothetical protein
MTQITITLSDAELKGMESITENPQEWAQNAVSERARLANNDIIRMYTERALNEGVQIPATRELIILDAFTRGWAKTAAEVNAEFNAQIAARLEATPEQTGQ